MPNTTNLSVVTESKLEEALSQLWSAMQTWVETNIDDSNIMTVVKGYLDQANREIIGTTATAKAQAILNSINAIAGVLEDYGIDISNLKTSEFASTIATLAPTTSDIFILAPDGTHYTVAQYEAYKEEHGAGIAGCVVGVITPYQSFCIAPTFPSRQWANTTDTCAGLPSAQTGSFLNVMQNGLVFAAHQGTLRMVMYYNPEVAGEQYYTRVATYADLVALGSGLLYDEQVYIVTDDENKGLQNTAYIWSGAAWSYRFVVPRVANNITGTPVAQYAWTFKLTPDDTRQWLVPTINHYLIIYVNRAKINECLYSINRSALPTSYSWTCQQNNAINAYYVVPSSGQVNSISKSVSYAVVLVSAL